MSPKPRIDKNDEDANEARDSAVRKLEAKEARTGTTPTPSVGRAIRDGQREGA